MGVAISRYSELSSNELLARFCSEEVIGPNEPFWNQLLAFNITPPTTASEQLMLDGACESLLSSLATHNPRSGNVGALVHVAITRATELLAANQDNVMLAWQTYNALFVVRAVCKYLAEMAPEHELCAHLDAPHAHKHSPDSQSPEESPTATGGGDGDGGGPAVGGGARESRVEMLIDTLFAILVDVPVTDNTYYVHLECVNTLLVLLSVYMFAPTHGLAHHTESSLIFRTVFGGRYTLHAGLVVRALLNNIGAMATAPPHMFGTGGKGGSLLIDIASGLWNMLSLSSSTRPTILTHPPADNEELLQRLTREHPLANQSCLLLLVLTHHCMDHNLYRSPLLGCRDIADAGANSPQKDEPPAAPRVDIQALHSALCALAACEHFTLLLYVLTHSCAAYRRHLARAPNIDHLIIPVLRVVYDAGEGINGSGSGGDSGHHVYMALIVLLILTEDEQLIKNIHNITIKNPVWYTERTLWEVSLGGLMILVIVRALQYNLARMRDKYLHTNCLAAIANMSGEFRNLHPYVCQRLVSLLDTLTRRRARLLAQLEGELPAAPLPHQTHEKTEEIMEHMGVLDEVIRMLLEIINSCVSHQLPSNLNLVYALLHRQELFQRHRHLPVTQNIEMVIGYFSSRLARTAEGASGGEAGGAGVRVDDVMQVLRKGAAQWSSDRLKKFPDLKFRYVEEDRPSEFFTPYVWALASAGGTLHFAAERIPAMQA